MGQAIGAGNGKSVKAVRFGETGYAYVLDGTPGKSQGTLMVHPNKEGQNLLDAKDTTGRSIVREMLERKQGAMTYPWVNAEQNEQVVRNKVVAFDSFPDWNWVIVGGTNVEEFESLAAAVSRQEAVIGTTATWRRPCAGVAINMPTVSQSPL